MTKTGIPGREIGIGVDRKPVFAGPTKEDYGFWLDTSMTISDFSGVMITAEEFEALWQESGAHEPD